MLKSILLSALSVFELIQSKTKKINKIIVSNIVFSVIASAVLILTVNYTENKPVYNVNAVIGTLGNEHGSPDETPTEPFISAEPGAESATKENPGENKDIRQFQPAEPATAPPVKRNHRIYQTKFDSLREIYNDNEDIIGIIKIPGTVVHYPVAYYPHDNQYYLDRNLFQRLDSAGSIFLDYENSVERYDPNTILYGHQMSSNSMFHTLNYYRDEDFFNEHRYIIYNTIYEDNVWEVFSFFTTHISFYYIKVNFRSERDFLDLAAQMKEKSAFETGIDIKEGDRILVLSTCTNLNPDTRYVLCARLIKNKDDIPEDIAKQMKTAIDDYK